MFAFNLTHCLCHLFFAAVGFGRSEKLEASITGGRDFFWPADPHAAAKNEEKAKADAAAAKEEKKINTVSQAAAQEEKGEEKEIDIVVDKEEEEEEKAKEAKEEKEEEAKDTSAATADASIGSPAAPDTVEIAPTILHGINVTFPCNRLTMIVGKTGSGKTSLLSGV